ncbi:hypothetical protein [Micrococcus luteus]|uniref:hypothetical protein n=1 Tax=Micrococcus luteus TaxID=1270 RepID=UPI00387A0B55
MHELLEAVRQWAASTPGSWQWLAVMAGGALPFVESYYGSVIGILVGISPWAAIPAAVAGNIASTAGAILWASRRRSPHATPDDPSRSPRGVFKDRRLQRRFEKFGVPGVCLGSQVLLPSQLTAVALVRVGAEPRRVLAWQALSITAWGLGYGSLAAMGVALLG